MKKIIVGSFLALAFCFPVYSFAQVNVQVESRVEISNQLQVALKTLINLLLQQVADLQAKLAETIAQQNIQAQQIQQIINTPTTPAPTVPVPEIVIPIIPETPVITPVTTVAPIDFSAIPEYKNYMDLKHDYRTDYPIGSAISNLYLYVNYGGAGTGPVATSSLLIGEDGVPVAREGLSFTMGDKICSSRTSGNGIYFNSCVHKN